MKKVLLALILALTFSGSVFAQEYESHWPPFSDAAFYMYGAFNAFVSIDGVPVTVDDNWAALEITAFVGTECRAEPQFMVDYTEEGDPYPMVDLMIWYKEAVSDLGQTVTFQMYDHANGIEYLQCTPNIEILTGEDHTEIYNFDYENAVYLNFISPVIEKVITPYDGETDGHWYLIASPVGTVNPTQRTNMFENDYDLYYFDQSVPETEWINRKVNDTEINEFDLEAGKGYLYANGGDGETFTLQFIGTGYTDDVTVTLNNVGGVDFPGWNLIGNPFNENLTLTRDFLVMNADGNDFTTVNRNYLEPMEGAFVFTEEEEEELTLYYPGGNAGSIPGSEPEMGLAISQGHGVIDRAVVRFGGNRTLPKFQLNPNHTKVYIPQEGKDYAVVSAGEMGEMPVNFKAEKSGTYTMSFSSKEVNFAYLHLIDNMTGNDVDLLATPVYTFDARNTDYASRFKLVFVTSDSNDENFAYFNNGNLIVSNDGEATLQVVDVMGRILSSETISGTCSKHINAAKGVYMIRVINGNDVKVQKIVVE